MAGSFAGTAADGAGAAGVVAFGKSDVDSTFPPALRALRRSCSFNASWPRVGVCCASSDVLAAKTAIATVKAAIVRLTVMFMNRPILPPALTPGEDSQPRRPAGRWRNPLDQ